MKLSSCQTVFPDTYKFTKGDFFDIFKNCESPGNEAISELEKFGSGQGKGMSLFFSC